MLPESLEGAMEKFFVVGCPRSGTTMVQQALNRHSQIVVPPETKFFFSFFGHPKKRQARHIGRINADLDIQLPRPMKQVASISEGQAYYEDMARQYVKRHVAKNVVHFGEKTPEHTGLLPSIRRLYPDAKILVLYRDGRDVASSLTRMPWMSPNLYVNFIVWLYYHSILQEERRSRCPNLYFARYEDVVADPEKEFKAILHFLGADYEPAVAAGHGNREGVPQREMAWKSRALQPITNERIGVFRQELSGGQIEILERLGRDALPALGYPLLTGGEKSLSPAFYLHLAYNLARFVGRLPWNSVAKELVSRLFSGMSTGRRFSSVPPFAYSVVPHAEREEYVAPLPAAQV
jgi:hypothetical protein